MVLVQRFPVERKVSVKEVGPEPSEHFVQRSEIFAELAEESDRAGSHHCVDGAED